MGCRELRQVDYNVMGRIRRHKILGLGYRPQTGLHGSSMCASLVAGIGIQCVSNQVQGDSEFGLSRLNSAALCEIQRVVDVGLSLRSDHFERGSLSLPIGSLS